MKTRLTELSNELGIEFPDLLEQAQKKLLKKELSGRGRGTWVTEAGANELRLNADIPEAVPEVLRGTVITTAPNEKWVYCTIEGIPGKKPVLVGRRHGGDKLIGKPIEIHSIEDVNGTSYRYSLLG